jgi:hypothetical protein
MADDENKKVRKCGFCGYNGHDQRTCELKKLKKIRKCGICGKDDHDKRKCPDNVKKAEVKPEINTQLQTVYGVLVKEDNGDDVHEWFRLFSTVKGSMTMIANVIESFNTEHGDSDVEIAENKAPTSTYYKNLFYYNDDELFNTIPVPTEEFVTELLKNTRECVKLLIKIGDRIGGAQAFGCEISVFKKEINV